MAALNPANTERWWAVYVVNGDTHRVMCRTSDNQTAANMSLVFHALFSRLTSVLYSLTVQNMEFSLRNSNVRNTAVYSQGPTYGVGTGISNDDRAKAISFVGRSVGGHKARFFVYGFKNDADGDFRTDTTESVPISDVVILLNGATTTFRAIDGLSPIYKAYANIGYSDHWIKEARKG